MQFIYVYSFISNTSEFRIIKICIEVNENILILNVTFKVPKHLHNPSVMKACYLQIQELKAHLICALCSDERGFLTCQLCHLLGQFSHIWPRQIRIQEQKKKRKLLFCFRQLTLVFHV